MKIKNNLLIKNKNNYFILGFSIYLLLSSIDRFLFKISDYIYIPICFLGMAFIIIGIIKTKDNRRN